MLQARQIALIDGKPVYRDCEGNLCTETSDYRFLRALTEKEEDNSRKPKRYIRVIPHLQKTDTWPLGIDVRGNIDRD